MKGTEEGSTSYKDMVDNSLVGIFQSNLAGEVLFVNDTLVGLMEHNSPEEMKARLTGDFYRNPSDQTALLQALKKEGRVDEFTAEVISGKGNSKFIRLSATLRGDIITGIVIDITENKRSEDALRASEEKYRVLVDNSPTGIFQSTVDGVLIFVNDALLEMFEYESAEDVISGDVFRFYKNPDDRKQIIRRLEKEKKIADVPLEMITQSGKAIFVHLSATLREGLLTGTILDVTQRILAEKELSRTRSHLRHVINTSPAVIYSCSSESGGKRKTGYTPTFVSDNIERLLGYRVDECLGNKKWWRRHLHPDDAPGAIENMKRLFEEGSLKHEYRVRHRNGDYRWIRDEMVLVMGVDGAPKEFVGSWSDVTEQKDAMIALRESEEQWRSLTENSPDYVMVLGTDLRVQLINYTLASVNAEDITGKVAYKLAQKKNQARFRRTLEGVLATGETALYSDEYISPDGEAHQFESRISAIRKDSKVAGLIVNSRDVTERHQAELALKESAEQWRSLAENTPDHIMLLDRDLVIRYLNAPGRGVTVEDVVGTTPDSHYPEEKRPEIRKIFQDVLRTGETATLYSEYRLPDGEMHYYESLISVRMIDGKAVGLTNSTRDITERRMSEDALKESEQQFRAIFENATDGICVADVKSRDIVLTNEFFRRTLGYEPGEFNLRNIAELHPEEELPQIVREFEKLVEGTISRTPDLPVLRKDGSVFYVDISASHISIAGRDCLVGFFRDITGRKQGEEALKKSEQKYRNLVDTAIVGIIQSTTDGEILFANQAVADMAGFGTVEELIAQGAIPRYKDAKQRKEWVEALKENGRVDDIEVEMLDRHGNICYGLLSAAMEGNIITSVTIDITDRVRADRELIKSRKELRNLTRKLESVREEERASIAREIHDELGQSMTALKMNLAWLRGKLLKGQEDLSEKVKSLEDIVDDNLQIVKKISSELRPTMLDDLGLAAAMEWHSQDFQKKTGIRCTLVLEPDDLEIDTDRSTTLFRIYQEAMTNIYRHAQATRVRISLSEDTGKVVLSINDNGRGIDDENITNAKSLGIVGMRERVYHWDGSVDIRRKKKGTVVTIAIPLP